jgi:hypothetical protein
VTTRPARRHPDLRVTGPRWRRDSRPCWTAGSLAEQHAPPGSAPIPARAVTRPADARAACRPAADCTSVTPVVSYSSQRIAQSWMHKVCRLMILSGRAAERGAEEGAAGEDRTRSRGVRRGGARGRFQVALPRRRLAEDVSATVDQDVSEIPNRLTTPTGPWTPARCAWPRNERGSAVIGDGGYAAGRAARR